MADLSENDLIRSEYNCLDCSYTYEVHEAQEQIFASSNPELYDFYKFQTREIQPVLLTMMNRGLRIEVGKKEELYRFFSQLMLDIKEKVNNCLGFEFNVNSSTQKKKLFKDFLGMDLKTKRGKGTETCDSAAMLEYVQEYPLYRPLLVLLLEYASIKVFTTTFLGMQLDEDNRARTQYRLGKVATYRLASSKNVFGKGGNFQNIPEKGKINLNLALQVIEEQGEDALSDYSEDFLESTIVEGNIVLPNCKQIFLPDIGKEICDCDFSGADAMVVAWNSECKWLIDFFTTRSDKLYAYIASEHLQREITSKSPEYRSYKSVCHGTNYGLGIDKLSSMLGISYQDAKQLQEFYLSLCPEIPKWHERIRKEVDSRGYITNIFGARGWFLNKNDHNLYNKAYAWTPQSTIGILVNKGIVNIHNNHKDIDILMQVHDSAVVQYDKMDADKGRLAVKESMTISLPYPSPLVIPCDIKVSDISYGDTKKPKIDSREFGLTEKRLIEEVL